jgi:hypothetical protein
MAMSTPYPQNVLFETLMQAGVSLSSILELESASESEKAYR